MLMTQDPASPAEGASASIQVFDKASGHLLADLPSADDAQVQTAAARARAAQAPWAALPVKERARVMKLARREFMRDREKIKQALMQETGKPPFDVIGEMFSVCQQIGRYSSKAEKWLRPRSVSTFPLFGKKGKVFYRPHGLVGVISPWNAPLTLALTDVLPALYAGNAVLAKPSEITPLAVQYAIDAFNRVLPDGLLQCVIGAGATGAALVDNVDMIAVTGSCQTGRRVMERASRRLTPVLLELGGKDPMIVLEDADLERAANAAAWGSCFMTGQVCMSVERIYVVRSVAAEFKRLLTERMRAIRTGPDRAVEAIDYGPVIGPKQVHIIEEQIAQAQSLGATVELGGARIPAPGGVYFQPTLLTGVDHRMKIMMEETFGPVACVMEVADQEEAIHLANDSDYGLNASVWTRDITRGTAIASRLMSGNVCVNDAVLNAGVQNLPFGGIRQSGVGSRHGGDQALHAFCYQQSMMIEKRHRPREAAWFPYSSKVTAQTEKVMKLFYGRGL